MALPGTHFRFALAVRDHYAIKDEVRYLAGTLYPDSRWLTGLARESTHHDDYLDRSFADTDFNTGWHVHVRCDHIQTACFRDAYPHVANRGGMDGWIGVSALKVAQDMQDSRQVDMAYCLDCLAHAETPYGEDIAGVRAYYRLVRRAYGAGAPPSQDAYHMLWARVGVPTKTVAAIMAQANQLASSAEGRQTLEDLFLEMVPR